MVGRRETPPYRDAVTAVGRNRLLPSLLLPLANGPMRKIPGWEAGPTVWKPFHSSSSPFTNAEFVLFASQGRRCLKYMIVSNT